MSSVESPRLLIAVVDRCKHTQLEDILREKQVSFQYLVNAIGTARSEILNVLGLSEREKTIGLCIAHRCKARRVMDSIVERMEMMRPGHGIIFTVPLSGVSKCIVRAFETENKKYAERQENHMEHTETHGKLKHELVIAIVNNGYSEEVMDVARAAGVRGGTVLHARQAAIEEASKFFGISLQPDKEIILIIAEEAHKVELMRSIGKTFGMLTSARGFVVSVPIESCAGLTPIDPAQC